jgi:hypothetical protein
MLPRTDVITEERDLRAAASKLMSGRSVMRLLAWIVRPGTSCSACFGLFPDGCTQNGQVAHHIAAFLDMGRRPATALAVEEVRAAAGARQTYETFKGVRRRGIPQYRCQMFVLDPNRKIGIKNVPRSRAELIDRRKRDSDRLFPARDRRGSSASTAAGDERSRCRRRVRTASGKSSCAS